MRTVSTAMDLALCLGSATVGGVFFAFSTFVLRALGQLPATQGIAAMQRINVVVLNVLFMGAFLATAILSLAAVARSLAQWSESSNGWLLASGLLYFIGAFLVTLLYNVPRNERLASLDPSSPAAAGYWQTYRREWGAWNHLRTAASLAAAACAAVAMVH